MTMGPSKTEALRLPSAMPVKTVSVDVADGPDRGLRWEGEQGTLGTAQDNALPLGDESVSGYHVRVAAVADGIRVSDLGSTNGTFLGDVRIEHCIVPPGSTLKLGRTSVVIGKGLPTTVELHDEDSLGALRGQTQAMRRLMNQVRRAAPTARVWCAPMVRGGVPRTTRRGPHSQGRAPTTVRPTSLRSRPA